MAKLVEKYIEIAAQKNPGEPEFLQTVEEVLTSIEPVLEAHPEYVKAGLVERLIGDIAVVGYHSDLHVAGSFTRVTCLLGLGASGSA